MIQAFKYYGQLKEEILTLSRVIMEAIAIEEDRSWMSRLNIVKKQNSNEQILNILLASFKDS